MEYTFATSITLILRPLPDSPPDMPPGDLIVEVPVHPRARPTNPDPGWAGPLAASSYIKRSDLVGSWIPLDLEAAFRWFDAAFGARVRSRGRSLRSDHVSLAMTAEIPSLAGIRATVRVGLTPDSDRGTIVT